MKSLLLLPFLVLLLVAAPPARSAVRPAYFQLSTPFPTDPKSIHGAGLLADSCGYVVVGYNESSATRRRSIGVAAANSAGKQLWSRTYGVRRAVSNLQAIRARDGGLLVWGRHTDPTLPYLLRIGASGESLWTRTYGSVRDPILWNLPPAAIAQTSDDGFVLAGTANCAPLYLLKTDVRGDTLWFRRNQDRLSLHAIQQTADGGYIIAGGSVYFYDGMRDVLIKTDSEGNLLWQKTFSGSSGGYGYSVQQTSDGGYIIAGWTFGAGGIDVYLIKVGRDCKPWDINFDGIVDFADYTLLANQWLQPPGIPSADIAPPPNGDQFVDFLDLAVFVEHWLKVPPPDPATNPNPANGATNVSTTPLLSWTPGAGATSHDVYFGTESPGTFQRNQTNATFFPVTLLTNKTYYWRIDEINSGGKTTGTVWSFTTGGKGPFCFPGDTLVWVDGAPMKISTVVSGQNIKIPPCLWSTTYFGQIERIEEHEGTFECYDIALETGNSISVADSHFFLTESGQWVPLQNLKPGSKLISSKGVISIKNIIKRTSPFVGKVYNLRIKDSDSYAIGEDGIIVRDY